MTKADIPTFSVIEGQIFGVWRADVNLAANQWHCSCINCGKTQIMNRREFLKYANSVCFYTRCSAFSVHFKDEAALQKWKSNPNHLDKIR